MDALQGDSQLDNQHQHQHQHQHLDSRLQSDSSVDSEKLVQILTHDFQNLVFSCNDEGFDLDLHGDSVAIDDVEDPMKQSIDDEELPTEAVEKKQVVDQAFEAESAKGAEEKTHGDVNQFVDEVIERHDHQKKVPEVDPKECRVLEDREIDEIGIGSQNQEEEVGDERVSENDWNKTHEIDEPGKEFGGYENNGNYREYEHLENVEGGPSLTAAGDGILKSFQYPLRPDAEDCSYYMRTGMCKYGSSCKFNHPLRRKHQPVKETQKPKEENMELHGQIECKYYLSPAGCKYGKSCKFSHGRVKTVVTPVIEHNFLGLPIRPGEKECPYYMRNGSCKYGPNCRYNHPDPSAVVSADAPTTYGNDGPLPFQPPPQPNMPTWTGPRTPDPAAAFVPVMYPPTQNMPPPNPDWNGYQAPAPVPAHVYPSSELGLPIPPAFFLNNPPSDANMYTHHQQPMVVSEYPERPGQPDCSYFMKTGDCKFRASCKFHHPRSRITRTTPFVLSDKGLPLRPDQNVCAHYSRYGICKYGPACKYDHPVNYNMNSNRAEGYDASDRSGPLIQQSV